MPNSLQVIEQRKVLGKDFRIYGDFENPLFLAKDIAMWIDYDLSSINKLVDMVDINEKVRKIVPTPGGNQEAWFLTEDGLYEVLMQSRKPIAKEFKKQVKEILKSIRKTGIYIVPNVSTMLQGLESAQAFTESLIKAGASPAAALEAARGIYKAVGVELPRLVDPKYYTALEVGKKVGMYSKKEVYVKYVIEHIINDIAIDKAETRQTYEPKGGYIIMKYTENVISKVEKWLEDHAYPSMFSVQRNDRVFLYQVGYLERGRV